MNYLNKLKQNKIIENILSLGSATLISAIFTFLVGVATRNILGPEQYGYYLTISLAFTFIPLFQLGTLNAMNREVPFYLARHDQKKVEEIRSLTFSFQFTLPLTATVLFLMTAVCLFFFDVDSEYQSGILLTAFVSFFLFLSGYVEMYYKSEQNFRVASRLMFIKSISQSILTLILVIWMGYNGLYIGMLVALIVEVYIGRKSFKDAQYIYNKKKYQELIKTGFPILLVGIVWSIVIAIDRLIIAITMSTKDLGNYGVGMLIFSSMMLLPQIIGNVMYPKIVELVSLKEYEKIKKYFWKTNIFLAIAMLLIIIIAFFTVPFFITSFMPQYIESVRAAQFLIIGIYPLTLVGFSANFFNSIKSQKIYILIQLITIFCNIIISICLLRVNHSIDSVAIGTSSSFFIYAALMNFYFFKKINNNYL